MLKSFKKSIQLFQPTSKIQPFVNFGIKYPYEFKSYFSSSENYSFFPILKSTQPSIHQCTQFYFTTKNRKKSQRGNNPIFTSDFQAFREANIPYIDKTTIIQYIQRGRVWLIIRQRRCGKSLALSTVDSYFNVLYSDQDRKKWFDGTEIQKIEDLADPDGERIKDMKGKLPVLKMDLSTLTVGKGKYARSLYRMIVKALKPYKSTINLKRKENEEIQDLYDALKDSKNDPGEQISYACELLQAIYNQKVLILIDEYDSPMSELLENQKELKQFQIVYSKWLRGGLKANEFIYSAIVTGVNQVSFNQTFSALNNLRISNMFIRDVLEDQYFITESELKKFHYRVLGEEISEVELNAIKKYYNGYYQPNNPEPLYNAYSIAAYYDTRVVHPFDPQQSLEAFWSATSQHREIQQFCKIQDMDLSKIIKDLAETLEEGKYVEAEINTKISLDQMFVRVEDTDLVQQYFYTLLAFGGYLTIFKPNDYGKINGLMKVRLPNQEAKEALEELFGRLKLNTNIILKGLATNNWESIIKELKASSELKASNNRVYDTEGKYHLFIDHQLRKACKNGEWDVFSEESIGEGPDKRKRSRFDLFICPSNSNSDAKKAYLIEIKKLNSSEDSKLVYSKQNEALMQISEKNYIEKIIKDPKYHRSQVEEIYPVAIVGHNRILSVQVGKPISIKGQN